VSRCRRCTPVPEEVRRAAGLLERRWTVSILWASYEVELEEAGLLERRVVDARPPRVEYLLTENGLRLRDVLNALAAYARA
jgi:DNA-binding HxlR family transcriptional regulator